MLTYSNYCELSFRITRIMAGFPILFAIFKKLFVPRQWLIALLAKLYLYEISVSKINPGCLSKSNFMGAQETRDLSLDSQMCSVKR